MLQTPGMESASKRTRARDIRRQAILDRVVSNGIATVAELTDLTGASIMTVHRDLDELAQRGIVRKFHGGVSAQPSTVFESSSEYRMRIQSAAKDSLAAAAVRFVEPGMSVMVDDSTTVLSLTRILSRISPLTVITNYLPAIQIVREIPEIHLIAIGGDYSATHDSFLGMIAKESIESLSVDVVFVSTSAMTTTTTFHQEQEIVLVKRAMLSAAKRRVLLMDSTKVGRTSLHRVAPVTDYDHIVLSAGVERAFVRDLGKRTKVLLAD